MTPKRSLASGRVLRDQKGIGYDCVLGGLTEVRRLFCGCVWSATLRRRRAFGGEERSGGGGQRSFGNVEVKGLCRMRMMRRRRR